MSIVFGILFFLSLVMLVVGLKSPEKFKNKKTGIVPSRKKVALTTGIFSFIFFILLVVTSPSVEQKTTTQTKESNNTNQSSPSPSTMPTSTATPEKQYSYEVLERNENNTVENYKVLIKAGDDGRAIAMEVKKGCKKPCNIDIYDDKKALELQKEYDAMMGTLDTQPEQLESWKQKNYIFVADHFVGYINFELDEYQEYPYKDWYYRELKNKK